MFQFLNYDSPFMTFLTRLFSLIVVSAMWAVCCIPIFTAGASTTALYYAVQKCIKNGRGTIGSVFWQGFKENFKKSTLITLILLAVAAIFAILHLPVTIVVAILGFGSVVLIYTFKPLILILPGVTVWIMSILTERVFRRYMSEEDKALEDERNMDYRDDYVGKRREQKKQEYQAQAPKKKGKRMQNCSAERLSV